MATDRTVYLIRTAGKQPAYLQWMEDTCSGTRYGWTGTRKNARMYVGRERTLAALAALKAAVAAGGEPVPELEAVPAAGGVAIGV
jgi:hypothetical protein